MNSPSYFYFLVCLGVVTPFVFIVCERSVRSTEARFESQLSLVESIRQLTILSAPYNSTATLRWVAGSVNKSSVTLECRTKGMRKPLMEFSGCISDEEDCVVLRGIFHMPFSIKCQLSLILSILTLFVVLAGREVIINHNQEAIGGIIVPLGLAAFLIFVLKIKTKASRSDMNWLASSIKIALQAQAMQAKVPQEHSNPA